MSAWRQIAPRPAAPEQLTMPPLIQPHECPETGRCLSCALREKYNAGLKRPVVHVNSSWDKPPELIQLHQAATRLHKCSNRDQITSRLFCDEHAAAKLPTAKAASDASVASAASAAKAAARPFHVMCTVPVAPAHVTPAHMTRTKRAKRATAARVDSATVEQLNDAVPLAQSASRVFERLQFLHQLPPSQSLYVLRELREELKH